jgi:hypothetical protein
MLFSAKRLRPTLRSNGPSKSYAFCRPLSLNVSRADMRAQDPQQAQTTHIGTVLEVFATFLMLGLTSFGGPIAHLGYFRRRKRSKKIGQASPERSCHESSFPSSGRRPEKMPIICLSEAVDSTYPCPQCASAMRLQTLWQ